MASPWPAEDTSYDDPNTLVADGFIYEITWRDVRIYAPDMRPRWLMRLAPRVEELVLENDRPG